MERNRDLLQNLANLFQKRFLDVVNSYDAQITKNLQYAGIQTRPAKSNGLWCCILLPSVLITYAIQHDVTLLYRIMGYTSVGILFYCILFIVFLNISCLVLKEQMFGGCIASGLVSTLLLYTILELDLPIALLIAMSSVHLFSTLLRTAIMLCPKTFTIGEAIVVVQSIVLFVMMVFATVLLRLGGKTDDQMEFVSKIVYAILSTVGLIVTALYLLDDTHRNVKGLWYIMIGAILYGLVVLHVSLGFNCIPRISYYIFMNKNRAQLFTFWLALAGVSAVVILIRTKLAVKADTVTRKTFHILASLVFMSGILTDVYLMTFAAGFGLGLLVLLEALRKSRIEPISSALQSAFLVYSDEKDVGVFAMTPLYLYCGLACGLVLAPRGPRRAQLAGVLATGVGDSAASWFGARYGFNKWPGGSKTLEGTAFNIISQVATVHALQMFELLEPKNGFIQTAFAATVSGLVEAKTDQVDNLVLPLVTLLAFQATWFLS